MDELTVRDAQPEHADAVAAVLRGSWGDLLQVAVHGDLYDLTALPTLVAVDGEGVVGVLTYRDDGDAREVVTVDAVRTGAGIGPLLLLAVEQDARRHGLRRLWLVTTNDNWVALRTYQRAGWELAALHRDAVARARRLKPSIPDTGLDDIPVRHELVLELPL